MGSDAAASEGPTGAVSVLNFELFPAHSLSICLVKRTVKKERASTHHSLNLVRV